MLQLIIVINFFTRTLRIRRQLVLVDMLNAFSNEDIMKSNIKVVVIDARGKDEKGEDVKGVYRDVLANFWQDFYIQCTLGERERVPSLRHDFQCEEWTAVARIIAKGYLDLGYFPVMLSPTFIISVLFGEMKVCEESLLHSFNRYLAPIDEDVVHEALKGGECEDGRDYTELIDLLSRYGCRKRPSKENVNSLISELAHKELIQRPRYVAECWRAVLSSYLKGSDLSTAKKVHDLFKALEPTSRKVLGMIQANPCNDNERSALDYLKRFIRGMEDSQLKSFLMFVTGADVLCVPDIQVEFTQLDRLARRPIAHTCGCVLELPSTYETYTELRAEFSNVLAQGKWQNDIC